jgi:Vacuolar sorting-associated protein 13, extended-chorein
MSHSLGHWHGYFYTDEGTKETDGTDSMMTLVLEPAEGEREVKANAWSNRGRYTVTGSWSTGENDILHIKLEMTFTTAFWSEYPVFFNGSFDPERDSLTGVWGESADLETSSWRMEFRRIMPRYFTAYPSIKEISDNKPRALWKFAIDAVRNDIRQDSWSWSFFSQRRDDREIVISWTIRSLFFGTPLDDGERGKLCEVVQRLTPADACFYSSKIDRIRANTWVHV